VLAGLTVGGVIYHRHRQVTERNEANLRYAYHLTSFTLGRLRDELRAAAPAEKASFPTAGGTFPAADGEAALRLPLNASGELDLRYYQALLADLHAATSETHEDYRAALTAIQRALDIFSQLAKEAPADPKRLLDAAQARLSFARLLDRVGRTDAAGDEAYKALGQVERLATWPGFDPAPLPPMRCDALRLAAKDAHRVGDQARAVALAREALAIAGSLPSGLLVRPEREAVPRLALAVAELATYATAADLALLPEVRREIDRATATCRAAHERDPHNPAMIRGLVHCLHGKARLALHEGSGEDLRPLFGEAVPLLIGKDSGVRLLSFPTIRSFCGTATSWAKAAMSHPDAEVARAALKLADELITYVRANGGATGDILIQRGRLFLYESQFACRVQDRDKAARAVYRAVRLLRPEQLNQPDRLSLALLTAAALHQARSLADIRAADWNEREHGAHLERLLKQLADRSAELTPEQRQELAALSQP
jgi:hypothetical protein